MVSSWFSEPILKNSSNSAKIIINVLKAIIFWQRYHWTLSNYSITMCFELKPTYSPPVTLKSDISTFKTNILAKIVYSLLKLPYHIKNYLIWLVFGSAFGVCFLVWMESSTFAYEVWGFERVCPLIKVQKDLQSDKFTLNSTFMFCLYYNSML